MSRSVQGSSGGDGRNPLLDDAAGLLVRPYTACAGRTRPSAHFELLTQVIATGAAELHLGPEHTQLLTLCAVPVSVAELAAQIRQPVVVTKVLLSDLVDCGAVCARAPVPAQLSEDPTDRELLEAVLDGLRKRL